MKKTALILTVSIAILLSGCASKTGTTSPSESSTDLSSEVPSTTSSEPQKTFNVDWEKCFDEMKPHIMGGDYDHVEDVAVNVDDSKKKITITAVFGDATKPSLAPEYADMVMRQFNTTAQMQDSSIKGGGKNYRGGLYDIYQTQIGIAPASKQNDSSKWLVFDTVPALAQTHEIKLQSVYH